MSPFPCTRVNRECSSYGCTHLLAGYHDIQRKCKLARNTKAPATPTRSHACACGICTVCMQVATNTATTKQTHARQLCHEGNDSVEPVRQVATAVRVRLAPAVFGVQPCRVDYVAPKPRKVPAQSIDLQRGEQRVEGSENANQWRSSSSSRPSAWSCWHCHVLYVQLICVLDWPFVTAAGI